MPSRKNPDSGTDDGGQAEVQSAFDKEQEQGFRGIRVDPTPLENYTLAGVTSGALTPESAPPDHPLSSRRDPEGVYANLGTDEVKIDTDAPGADRAAVQEAAQGAGEDAAK